MPGQVESERIFTDNKVKKIVELKRRVCTPENKKTFVVLNQKGPAARCGGKGILRLGLRDALGISKNREHQLV